ncbi:fibronectin type III domain-containing protein [Streptomyces sp. P01-B04]|uniref:fibronectin type III domain-containing protein n=1 Tax=Streptomyces poriferorum TaxID=2798799 RepID=UPI001C5FDEC2|nr:fibronectin type III domain-containing protein [Streptomyces poriferorum]MBW5252046.1 fibronectin type III domain-containing protein [Streptomyces poriferorum]
MADTIDIPKIGAVKKTQVMAVGGIAGGIILFAFWRSRSAAVDDAPVEEVLPEDPFQGLTDSGLGGSVGGYSSSSSGSTSDTQTSAPRTNAEWSQLASEKLAASYEPAAIDGALGRYLGRQPLTTLDQTIVRAAIARAGYPPEGTYTVITGGDSDIKVAPTGLKAVAASATAVDLTWALVAGASRYRIYRSGSRDNVGTSMDGTAQVGGLQPNVSYTFQVAAETAAGKVGPKSSAVSARTKSVVLKVPTGVKVSKITRSGATVSWTKVPNATIYRLYVDGVAHGAAEAPPYAVGGLTANKSHKVTVAADATGQSPSKQSAAATFKTLK